MNRLTQNGIVVMVLLLSLFFVMVSCGKSDIDEFLDSNEKMIVMCEKMIKKGSITQDDADKYQKALKEYVKSIQILAKSNEKPSEEQTKRLKDLEARWEKIAYAFQTLKVSP